jgi:hypothetical protein
MFSEAPPEIVEGLRVASIRSELGALGGIAQGSPRLTAENVNHTHEFSVVEAAGAVP